MSETPKTQEKEQSLWEKNKGKVAFFSGAAIGYVVLSLIGDGGFDFFDSEAPDEVKQSAAYKALMAELEQVRGEKVVLASEVKGLQTELKGVRGELAEVNEKLQKITAVQETKGRGSVGHDAHDHVADKPKGRKIINARTGEVMAVYDEHGRLIKGDPYWRERLEHDQFSGRRRGIRLAGHDQYIYESGRRWRPRSVWFDPYTRGLGGHGIRIPQKGGVVQVAIAGKNFSFGGRVHFG